MSLEALNDRILDECRQIGRLRCELLLHYQKIDPEAHEAIELWVDGLSGHRDTLQCLVSGVKES